MSAALSLALPPSTMMYTGATSSAKRKLDAIIRDLTTLSQPIHEEEDVENGLIDDSSAKDDINNNGNPADSLQISESVTKRRRTSDEDSNSPSPKANSPAPTEDTMDSDGEAASPSAEQSFATASVIESIRADFLLREQQATSALRDQLLEPTTSFGHLPPPPPLELPQTSTPSTSTSSADQHVKVTNVYRGLYPIKNVKEHFKKKTIDNQKLYICQWPGCTFQTWKYSQHISRHIYLKHIGIKELRCQVATCDKVFKRPESLVQHVKNHICGFGIDPVRMKDPANICGVKNIKKHFTKIMDNDIQVFMCQFDSCQFVTNNSGSIRRHVHNQHICPHSSPAATANGTGARASTPSRPNNGDGTAAGAGATVSEASPFHNAFPTSGSNSSTSNGSQNTPDEESSPAFDPLVVLTEYEGQTYDPVNRSINHERESSPVNQLGASKYDDLNADSPMDLSGLSVRGINSSIPASLNRLDADEDDEDEVEDEELVSVDEPKVANPLPATTNGHYFGLPGNADAISFPLSGTSAPNFLQQPNLMPPSGLPATSMDAEAAAAAARRKNNGLYSLKNYKEHYYKIKTAEAGVQFICKGCKFQAKSQITLIRHLWNELGYKEFHCEFEGCSRTFDNEFSRYKHRKFDHGQPTQAPGGAGEATTAVVPIRPEPSLLPDRFSPIPPLVPLSNPMQPGPPPAPPTGSSYSAINAMFNLPPPPASSSSSHTFLSNYLTAPGIPFPSISTATVTAPTTHHLSLPTPHHPHFLPVSTSTSGHDRVLPALSTSAHYPSPPRRYSNGSLSDASTSSAAINSSLISILQAPSVAGAPGGSLPTSTPFGVHPPAALDHPLVPTFGGPIHPPLDYSSPLPNGVPDNQSRRPSTGIYSLKLYADRFEKQTQPNGDILYRCRLCDHYKAVRSQVSIVKHLRAHERGEIPSGERAGSPSAQTEPQAEQPRQRTSSIFSLGALSSGGEIEDDEDEDREISVEDGADGAQNSSDKSSGSIRKYNCRSKSGLYSLKKHESDYIRSKGPDGYHYKCANCDEYTTKSQASMVRHIWTHKKQHFRCDCGETFENEFSLYKHKKTTHPELTSQHNRSSSKHNKEAKERKEAAAAAAAAAAATTSTAPPPASAPGPSFSPADFNAEQHFQQQAIFNLLNNAQQFFAMQQMAQAQAQFQQESTSNFNAGPQELAHSSFTNLSAQNLAQVYGQAFPNSKVEQEEQTESKQPFKEPEAAAAQPGMSRRALRFKSHQRKPVQIRQHGSDNDDGDEAPEDEQNAKDA